MADSEQISSMIADIDRRLNRQLDAIVHHPRFQRLERSWRGIRFVVECTRFDENIRIELLNCSKHDLRAAFEAAPELAPQETAFHRAATSTCEDGWAPVAAIVADYEFDSSQRDIGLLRSCASVAARLHAPFITAARAAFFGLDALCDLTESTGVMKKVEKEPSFAAYRGLRADVCSQYLGLLVPRFLLRPCFGIDSSEGNGSFCYVEQVARDEDRCWGNPGYAFTTRLVASFAAYRWCPNIVGRDEGGELERLPSALGESNATACAVVEGGPVVDVAIGEDLAWELSFVGLIGLGFEPTAPTPCFLHTMSAHEPKYFGREPESVWAEFNYRLNCNLAYRFMACRFAHYLELFLRQEGDVLDDQTLERRAADWFDRSYVHDAHMPTPKSRAARPLTLSSFEIRKSEWQLSIKPLFHYRGGPHPLSKHPVRFTLTVRGCRA